MALFRRGCWRRYVGMRRCRPQFNDLVPLRASQINGCGFCLDMPKSVHRLAVNEPQCGNPSAANLPPAQEPAQTPAPFSAFPNSWPHGICSYLFPHQVRVQPVRQRHRCRRCVRCAAFGDLLCFVCLAEAAPMLPFGCPGNCLRWPATLMVSGYSNKISPRQRGIMACQIPSAITPRNVSISNVVDALGGRPLRVTIP